MPKHLNPSSLTRRQFLYASGLAASAAFIPSAIGRASRQLSANDKLNIAVVGCGGKGASDLQWCSSQNIIAVCDVSESATNAAKNRHPDAKVYRDFREMLAKEPSIDAVDIATPDHQHAIIAATAIKMGKHVYCQKPLTHDVYEARLLRDLAKQYGVATQMGNQGSASDGLRRAVEVVHAGVIGPVKQVYVWTNRPIWPQGLDRPPGSDPVPAGLDWDLWLGTAPFRPYKATRGEAAANPSDTKSGKKGHNRGARGIYQPFNWRGWQDFGTGALGDMACHTVNWPFRALDLGYPSEIEAESSGMNTEMYPANSRIRFEFPARGKMPPVTLFWSDGGNKPPKEITADIVALQEEVSNSGCLMIGEGGSVFSPDDGDQNLNFWIKLKGEKDLVRSSEHEAVKRIPETLPRNAFQAPKGEPQRSPDERQHLEWIAACKGGKPGYSNFDIAAYLTEIILLGCVALRAGKRLEWDGPGMRATNAPEAARFVRREYREGWKI